MLNFLFEKVLYNVKQILKLQLFDSFFASQ